MRHLSDPVPDILFAGHPSPSKPSQPRHPRHANTSVGIIEKDADACVAHDTSSVHASCSSSIGFRRRTRALRVDIPRRVACSLPRCPRSGTHDAAAKPPNIMTHGDHLTLPCLGCGAQDSSRSTTANGSVSSSFQDLPCLDSPAAALPVITHSPVGEPFARSGIWRTSASSNCSFVDGSGYDRDELEIGRPSFYDLNLPAQEVPEPLCDASIREEGRGQETKSATDIDNEFRTLFSSLDVDSEVELADTSLDAVLGATSDEQKQAQKEEEDELKLIWEEGRVSREFMSEARKADAKTRNLNSTMDRVRSKLLAAKASFADISSA